MTPSQATMALASESPGDQLVLDGCHVVELGAGPALAYAGKLFADFGATVVKVEPPGGDAARLTPPLVDVGGGRRESAFFAWLNTNKRSLCADLKVVGGDRAVLAALANCEVLLDARPPQETCEGALSHTAIREHNPDLTIVAVSWFGETGPYRDFAGSDVVSRALAGLLSTIGPRDRPMTLSDHQSYLVTGLTCFNAALVGVMSKGTGRRFSVSSMEAAVPLAEWHCSQTDRSLGERQGINRFPNTYPVGIFPTASGWIGIGCSTIPQWRQFCDLFDIPDADDPKYATAIARSTLADEIESIYAPKLLQRTAKEWFAEALKRRLPFAVVPTLEDLLAPDSTFSSSIAPVSVGLASFRAPSLPLRLGSGGPLPNGRAPLPDEARETPERGRRKLGALYGGAAGPLAGLRIVDLSMGWAGPLVTRQLADLGAQVIKVEACGYPDWWRGNDLRPVFFEEKRYEKSGAYIALNRNKIDITLDLTRDRGRTLLKQLVRISDAVVENYARDVMPKLGLGYETLRAENDKLVMLSMAAFPAGLWDAARAYGYTLEQASGLPLLAGDEGSPPMLTHYALGDPIGGINGFAALLLALLQRQGTGKGLHVDLAQVECLLPHLAPWLIEMDVSGQKPPRLGNRHPTVGPCGIYRCKGPDGWLAVTILDDAMWARLDAIISGGGASPARSSGTAALRARGGGEIDKAIEAWTSRHEPQEAMEVLQANRIAAGVVRHPFDLAQDPHLKRRDFWQSGDHPFVGRFLHTSPPIREIDAPFALKRVAPTLGQDNEFVLREILGLSNCEIAELSATGIIGTEARPAARGA